MRDALTAIACGVMFAFAVIGVLVTTKSVIGQIHCTPAPSGAEA